MNPMRNALAGLTMALLLATGALAQPDPEKPGQADADERDPTLKHWKWMAELRLPDKLDGTFVTLPIPPEVLNVAQQGGFGQGPMDEFDRFKMEEIRRFQKDAFAREPGELRDLRLTDAKGERQPFALRIMRDYYQRTDAKIVRKFNAAPSLKSRVFEASYELADVPAPGHNEIEIYTTGGGRNFRRKVEVFGDDSDEFTKPKSLLGKGSYLVYFNVDGKIVDIHRFGYEEMRYRFLQVRVHADDPAVDEEIPTITNVVVRRRIEVPGEFITEPANFGAIDQVRTESGPGTAYTVILRHGQPGAKGDDVAAERIPCEKLTFEFLGEPSERPMRLEIADVGEPRRPIYGVDFQWRKDVKRPDDDKGPDMQKRSFLDVRFSEVVAQRLRLVVTDKANPPLQLNRIEATRAVRKLIFARPDAAKSVLPLRLFAGNPSVGAPGYVDFAKSLPEVLKPAPPQATLGGLQPNPSYEPPPKTLQERMPWLVHVVLGLASLVLLVILAALVKQAIARHDASRPDPSAASPVTP